MGKIDIMFKLVVNEDVDTDTILFIFKWKYNYLKITPNYIY